MPMRELILVKSDDDEQGQALYVQYINENTYNVYSKDENGFMTPVLLDAECHPSDKPDQLIVRNDHHLYRVDYFMDSKENNVVTQLDYEGSPLPIKVKKTQLVRSDEGEDGAAQQDSVKSPMPGTVVKVLAKEGDNVKAGDILATLESMKMEYQIKATHDSVIGKVLIEAGQFVNQK